MRRYLCLVSGGHRWQTIPDSAGSVTSCVRCGVLRHTRIGSVKDASFAVHTDLAADFSRPPAHGADELDASDRH